MYKIEFKREFRKNMSKKYFGKNNDIGTNDLKICLNNTLFIYMLKG